MENGILSFGGSWTEEKLEILRKYLRAYTTALKKQRFNLIYIDALAGTGYCGKDEAATPDEQLGIFPELMEQDAQAYIEGSARIALQIEPPFERYIYIDLDPKNCARLHDLKAEYPDRADRIEVVNADANDYILQLVQTTDWANTRAVMFLDPYGMEVGWDTVRWVASSKGIDLWYLFPISAVNRMLTKKGELPAGWVGALNRLFGSPDWATRFYTTDTDKHLFDKSERTTRTATWQSITEYIIERLSTEFPGVAREPRYLKNLRTNTILYLICFAAAKPGRGAELAVKMAQDILSRMDK